jgi:4-amino-4-deoxy-L-arabinose transferase-like glycosyltransferase
MQHTPNPALVSQRAAQRLPRIPLLLLCAAYVLPGVFGRDPWKNADITTFGYMMSLVRGDASWLAPAIAGTGSDSGLLPYWLGAVFIKLAPWVEPALAARIPFALLLVGVLVLMWYATFHLARTEAAQPVPFAFGGEAGPVDYARAIADGALLGLIACLGLLQLGHETTPELVQLLAVALFLYAMAAAPFRAWTTHAAMLAALPMLAASGAPVLAVLLAALGTLVCRQSSYEQVRGFAWWVFAAGAVAAGVATALAAWSWRLNARDAIYLPRLVLWFTWPVWPLVAWTLWRWRRHLTNRHISVPATTAGAALVISAAMGASDRALMLALPALAMLAAFALPTLKRSVSSAIDWFSVFFFTFAGIAIWVIYASMHTGAPAKPAANVAKLAPGFVPQFDGASLLFAVLATAAWLALVQWRAGRHRHPLWKSLVLPAGGVALSWLLLMTLLLPPLDYARSYRAWIERIATHVPRGACVTAPGLSRAQLAALEVLGQWTVSTARDAPAGCDWRLVPDPSEATPPPIAGWAFVAVASRPTDRREAVAIHRRADR